MTYDIAQITFESLCWLHNNKRLTDEVFNAEHQKRRKSSIGINIRANPTIDHLPHTELLEWEAIGRASAEEVKAELVRRRMPPSLHQALGLGK